MCGESSNGNEECMCEQVYAMMGKAERAMRWHSNLNGNNALKNPFEGGLFQ